MANKSTRITGEGERKGNSRGAPLLYLALTVSYMAGIYWLSSIPGEVDPESLLKSIQSHCCCQGSSPGLPRHCRTCCMSRCSAC
jgi:hypothetical protein